MKKLFCAILSVVMLLSFSACSGKDSNAVKDNAKSSQENMQLSVDKSADKIDVDLSNYSTTMLYSEVYNMLTSPDSYRGKIVKMCGQFSVYEDPQTNNQYFAVVVADTTQCCSQGLEFVLKGNHTYPQDYPQIGDMVTVTGEFQTYTEGEQTYCHLVDACLDA